jgi:uncharacterized MAPEG superfamily protein
MQHELSTELRYLIYTAILMLVLWIPYILAELKMTGVGKALSYPDERSLPEWGQRLKQAHYNLLENIGPFAVAVLAGELLGIHTALTAACAMIFFWARVAHPIAQVMRIWGTRTAAFAVGLVASLVYLFTILVGGLH